MTLPTRHSMSTSTLVYRPATTTRTTVGSSQAPRWHLYHRRIESSSSDSVSSSSSLASDSDGSTKSNNDSSSSMTSDSDGSTRGNKDSSSCCCCSSSSSVRSGYRSSSSSGYVLGTKAPYHIGIKPFVHFPYRIERMHFRDQRSTSPRQRSKLRPMAQERNTYSPRQRVGTQGATMGSRVQAREG